MKTVGLRDTWHDFGAPTKALFVGMSFSGVVLFVVSLAADLQHAGWMADHAFIPNALAGFSSFLVGVPFALVGLGTITGQREEKAAYDRVQSLTAIAWGQFRDAVYEFCDKEKLAEFARIAAEVSSCHDQALERLNFYWAVIDHDQAAYQGLQHDTKDLSELWAERIIDLGGVIGNPVDSRRSWQAIVRDWITLDQYVRLQRLERKRPWIDRLLDSVLQSEIVDSKFPLSKFHEIHGGYTGDYDPRLRGMHEFCGQFVQLQDMSYSEFKALLYLHNGNFPAGPVGDYMIEATRARLKLQELRVLIEVIDGSGWIEATAPQDSA